jgi:hypothetical protein
VVGGTAVGATFGTVTETGMAAVPQALRRTASTSGRTSTRFMR